MSSHDAAPAAGRPVPPAAYGHLLVIYIVWGAAYLAVKLCLTGPATITTLQLQSSRMWLAAALLAGLMLLRLGPPPRLSHRDLFFCAASGIMMWVAGNGLATVASRHAASSFIVMALGAIPLWSSLLDLFMSGARPSRQLMAGLLVGLAGLVLVVVPPLLTSDAGMLDPGYAPVTVLMLAGAGLTWSFGTLLQRPLSGRAEPGWIAVYQLVAAATVLTPPMLIEHAPLPHGASLVQLGAFAFLVVFGSVIGMTSFIKVTRSFGPAIASTFAYVNPVVGILLGWLVRDEAPAALSLVGMAIVLAGIAVVLNRPVRAGGVQPKAKS
ncbi:MAG: permease [Chelatococcus sp.]|nr:MAG: permease [Chelatococcus sp.]